MNRQKGKQMNERKKSKSYYEYFRTAAAAADRF